MSIIIFLIILAVLVLVHEFGHFIAAKRLGIRVDEFGLGFPPRIWGVKRGETIYSVNWIPFGGFVKIFGEDPDEVSLDGPDATRSFATRPRWAQAIVLVAGIACNVLFAWLLLSIGFMSGMPTAVDESMQDRVTNTRLLITSVEDDTPAAEAGLKPGDAILSLERGGDVLETPSIEEVRDFIAREVAPLIVQYERDGAQLTAEVVPATGIVADRPAIGISMEMIGTLREPIHRAIFSGGEATVNMFVGTLVGFGTLIADTFRGTADLSQVTGPVGIAAYVGDAAQFGFTYLLSFVAFISVNLAVINLLPFPALDGGRLLFVAIEAVRRRRINPKVTNVVNAVGFVILIALMLVVTYRDIVRLF
jgi:regulator of sigma E protease